jgi:hypothetical protein
MVMVFEGTPQQYSMDGYLKTNLDDAKHYIKNDWDMLFLIDGPEGAGKSVFGMQCGFYCDPTMTLDRYAFSPYQFRKMVMTAQPYTCVVYDEAHSGLNARAAMTMVNRTLVSMMTEIRQKNLFIFVVLPSFFDVDRYVAIWRARALFHVYTADNMERGYFACYNQQSKKMLYLNGKKLYQYGCQRPDFIGRFPNFYPLDEAEYRKRKVDALKKREKDMEDAEIQHLMYELMWEKLMALTDMLTHSQIMRIMDMRDATYYRKLKQWREDRAIG